ncbi:hypothetical protein CVT25_000879 [Psilocybe cyanescens]|uniref:Uncharacterized protein n=1 Tax=Psilocybe cyanescens TaxID=93625 RepID=A0A409XF80_PSICY|nr:hypothetical protein CVT25_000879 [Psilocybe cyanescens]
MNVGRVLIDIEKYLTPIIEYRLEQDRIHGGKWPDKPSDLITWLLDAAKALGEDRTPRNTAKRVVVFRFASTCSSVVHQPSTLVLTKPKPSDNKHRSRKMIQGSCRRDVHDGQLPPRDAEVKWARRVLQPFTFSDAQGTTIPAGTHLCVNA